MNIQDIREFGRQFAEQIINQKRLERLAEFVPENFVEEVPLPGQGPGRAGLRDVLTMFHTAFPDLRWQIDETVAEGEKLVSRFTMTGTHSGPFLGLAPTGRAVRVWGITIDVIRGGQMVSSRILMDTPTLMQQLTGSST